MEPKEFVINILKNLILRLNYKQDWNLGGVIAWNMVQRLQHSISIQHRAMSNKRKKKGPRSTQDRRQDLLHQVVGRQFLFRGYNKMAKKGREIQVHFTFVMDKFASARPLNLLIIYSVSCTSGSYNSFIHFACLYDSWKRLVSNDFP